jgi:hypothetical protein
VEAVFNLWRAQYTILICDLHKIRFTIFSPFVIISTNDRDSSDFPIEILRLYHLSHAHYKPFQATLIAPIIPWDSVCITTIFDISVSRDYQFWYHCFYLPCLVSSNQNVRWVGFFHLFALAQITLTLVMMWPLLCVVDCFCGIWNATALQLFNVFCVSESIFI